MTDAAQPAPLPAPQPTTLPIEQLAASAKAAAPLVATLPRETKDTVLRDLAKRINASRAEILEANAKDMDAARAADIGNAKLRRLELTDKTLDQVIDGLNQIADMADPIGTPVREYDVPSGLNVKKVRTPLGVIAMVYEARPAVTIDAFALCFKAGNACLLKGGKEANFSNACLAQIAKDALEANGAPANAIAAITTSDREELRRMLTLSESIDLVIPRGGETLIRFVHEHARIPTVQHFKGVCHIYVDKDADLEKALQICVTAKTSAPATCNTVECLLVHEAVAGQFLPKLAEACQHDKIEVRADEESQQHMPGTTRAMESDWGTEYLDLILAVRTVESIDEAIGHIRTYTSDHTEAILTEDQAAADRFTREVQSSCVLVNASTRFNDGFQLGLGAEIGISTSRIHAFGPMGLEELTVQRFIVNGDGQWR